MAITITKPVVGGSNGTWGTELNTALDTIVNGVNQAQATADAASGGGGTGGIPTSTVTAKGDLIVATANATVTRHGVGTTGYQLTADPTTGTGLAWKLSPGSLYAHLRQTTAQSIPTSTFTSLTWQVADFNRTGSFSSGTSTFTPGIAGWYELTGGITFNSTATGYRALQWVVSGTPVPASATAMVNLAGAIPEAFAARTVVVQLGATDTIALQAWHSNSTSLATYISGAHGANMTIKWLGAN